MNPTKTQAPSMESVIAPDGTRIAYQRNGDGPPLVLVHGSADDHTRWSPLLPVLCESFTVYALDRRGRGASGATDAATYSIEREFEDLATVVDGRDSPVYLLGHSYGAICALEAALRTNNVRKLVLYEPPIPTPPDTPISAPQTRAKMKTQLAAGDREGALLTFGREIVRLPEEAIAAMRSTPEWQMSIDTVHTIVYEVQAVEKYTYNPGKLRALSTPTLLLLGSESPPFLQASTEALAALLPHSQLLVLPGEGHVAMDTAPELFVGEVVRFLAEE